jgi:DNA-binding transcriptional MerR regulator/methanogenic corrinoid protein MtbC1
MVSRRKSTPGKQGETDGAWLSIGALSRSTGIAVETLRTWENRYGFPVPRRKPSGHRVYPVEAVPRLRRIAGALTLGHRAGQVVGASDLVLDQLLASTAGGQRPAAMRLPPAEDLDGLLRLVREFDAERLTYTLLGDWGRLSPIEFLEGRIAPLLRAVGDGWERQELEIRHEHFISERIGDLLRTLRLPFEERASGPLVVLATLPGEAHELGLQMAALLLASQSCRTLYLGPQVPPAQTASLAMDLAAGAVALSVSLSSKGPATESAIRHLREGLPSKIALIVGGDGGVGPSDGVDFVESLRELEEWGARFLGRVPAPPRRKVRPSRRT